MSRVEDDYALLLEAPDSVGARLAKNLLSEAGIPCFFHGLDRDFAELGFSAHLSAARPNVFVAKRDLERAKQLLIEAWGALQPEPPGPDFDPEGLGDGEEGAER
jgi:hypothetical protein